MTHAVDTAALEAFLKEAVLDAYPELSTQLVKVAIPTDKKKADFVSNCAFLLAKEVGASPLTIAQTIAPAFEKKNTGYHIEVAAPGFINFRVNDWALANILQLIITQKDQYGQNADLQNQTWVIEHTSPNPNKAMHVGHLRNNLLGMSIANLLEFSGAKVVRDWVDNDRGIAIAKAMWGYLVSRKKPAAAPTSSPSYELLNEWYEQPQQWVTPAEVGIKSDQFVGDCYTVGSEMFKNDDVSRDATRKLALEWEQGDEKVWKLWELILSYAHTGIFETLDRIGNRWDNGWHEHEHYTQGKELVTQGLEKGIFTRLDDGAVLSNLNEYNLPDTVVLKSDGTSLYITQDIALTKLKKETYNANKLMWVIGPEQTVAMKQVFAICEQLGIGSLEDFIHIPYGLISIGKDGARKKMSSRGGEAVLIDTLLDTVRDAVLQKERGYTKEAADKIAIAAVKFAMLKPARTTDTIIDIDQMVNLEGDSGVYVLYTMARMRALLSRAALIAEASEGWLFDETEHTLIVNLSYFPSVLRSAVADFSPSTLVEYALDSARSFNAVYARERFITDDVSETQKKMYLAAACLGVLENITRLLGMPRVDEI